MSLIELIIFDCDGVLVDSEPLANRVLADYLTEIGLPTTAAQTVQRFVGLSFASIRKDILAEDGKTLPDDFEEEVLRRDKIVFQSSLKAIDGINDILDQFPLPHCVASSGTHAKIRNSLTLTNLLPYFENVIFSADDVSHGKPAPDLFLHAASEMNTSAQNTIVIEDSLAGVEAGVAANMRVFGFLGGGHILDGHGQKLMKAGAEQVFSRMSDLPGLI
jgi:HAD superfamily hydrolase (TIGR01509 family)